MKHTHKIILLFFFLLATGCAETRLKSDADELSVSGKWDEAVLKYAELAQKDPANIEYKSRYLRARAEAAQIHFKRGDENLAAANHESASLEYQAALLLDPGLGKARLALKKTKRIMDSIYYYGKAMEALKEKKEREARAALKKAISLNPENKAAIAELEGLKKLERPSIDGYELTLKSREPITLEFKETGVKKVFDVLSKLTGINFIFDEELKDSKTSLNLKNATFQQALELILVTNKIAKKIVSENTIIIYPQTPQKAQQYDELMIKVFYLANTDAKKMINLLRTMIKAKDMQVHDDLNAIIIRARPDVLELATKILDASDVADSEVMLAVEIFEIDRNKAINLGLDLSPDTISASIPMTGGTIPLNNLKQITSGQLLIGLPTALINLKKEDLDANILANPKIRVKNNNKAKIHIGDRVPIITTTINQGISTENIQYQDVGLKLNVEPTIRPGDAVDLKVGLEVSSLGTKTTTNNGSVVYQIGTRNTETVLRLHDGETEIIGGLISDEERTTVAKIPLLGDIPLIGKLFSRTDSSKVKTDILLSITPQIIQRVDVPDSAVNGIFSGKDDSPSNLRMLESYTGDGEDDSVKSETGTKTINLDNPTGIQATPVTPPQNTLPL